MSTMNFLKVTPNSVLQVLERLAMHYPRSKQVTVLEFLAEDYAYDCRAMRQHEFEEAAARARAKSKYFPTSNQILAAWDELKQEQRIADADITPTEHFDGPCTNRAAEIIEALRTGRKPWFVN